MNFKQFLESERMRPFLAGWEQAQDLTDLSFLDVMSDALEESGDEDVVDFIQLIRQKDRDQNLPGNTYDKQIHELSNKIDNDLRAKHLITSYHHNEIIDQRHGWGSLTFYYWNGNNVRVKENEDDNQYKDISINDIKDPDLLKAIVYIAVEKYMTSKHPGRENFLSHEQDSILREYLQPLLLTIETAERYARDTLRLQRNNRAIRELQHALRYGGDRESFLTTIERHLKKYKSPFLQELATRLQTLLATVNQLYTTHQIEDIRGLRNVQLFQQIIELIRKHSK